MMSKKYFAILEVGKEKAFDETFKHSYIPKLRKQWRLFRSTMTIEEIEKIEGVVNVRLQGTYRLV